MCVWKIKFLKVPVWYLDILKLFSFNNTDYYSLRVLANIPFLSNSKYWFSSDRKL